MATETFTCDSCGQQFPTDQMKEVFEEDTDKTALKLCPSCLDKRMGEAGEVFGVEGEEKKRAALVTDEPGQAPEEPVTGKRETTD
jgi:NAD-dependent SIR2 family protein deacetylase